jgi:hypothetical protein
MLQLQSPLVLRVLGCLPRLGGGRFSRAQRACSTFKGVGEHDDLVIALAQAVHGLDEARSTKAA